MLQELKLLFEAFVFAGRFEELADDLFQLVGSFDTRCHRELGKRCDRRLRNISVHTFTLDSAVGFTHSETARLQGRLNLGSLWWCVINKLLMPFNQRGLLLFP